MFRFIYISDLHTFKSGFKSRNDDYEKTLFKKLKFVFEYAKEYKADAILCGGDVLHVPSPSDDVINRFLDLLKKYKIKFYSIWGNHDMARSNLQSIKKGKIGVMLHSRYFIDLVKNPIVEKKMLICGKHYTKDTSCCESISLDIEKKSEQFGICLLHTYVGNKNVVIKGKNLLISYENFEVYPLMDLVFTGHWHNGYGIVEKEALEHKTIFCNPGSLMRTNALEGRLGIGPGLCRGAVSKGNLIDLERVRVPHKKRVFAASSVDHVKDSEIAGRFVEILEKVQDYDFRESSILKQISFIRDKRPEGFESLSDNMLDEIEEKIKTSSGKEV